MTDKNTKVQKSADDVGEFFFNVTQTAGSFEALLKSQPDRMTMSQWALLKSVSDDSARPAQIARKLAHSRQMIQKASRKLIKDGLLESSPIADDKKAVNLKITKKGKDALKKIESEAGSIAAKLNDEKPGLNLAQSGKILGRVSRVMNKNFVNPKGEKATADA